MTDANLSFLGGAKLHPSTGMNTDSFMRAPASPLSFSSNNISGSSVIDGPIMQQSPPQEQVQKRRSSSVTSHPMIEAGGAFHAQKKSRIDFRQDDVLQHQLIQQLLHGQSSIHLQGQQNPQLQALIQQHKLAQIQQRQQQQLLQPLSQIQQSQIGTPHLPQLKPPLVQPAMQLAGRLRNPAEGGLCSRRLMQFLYHKRHRPENNPITYWKKLVEEYFAPRARERWCAASYEKRGNSSVSAPQPALDALRCDICNSHGGRVYEATYEVLPRLCQIRFDQGVLDEYLFLDMPNECRLPNGLMLLEHTNVVQKSVYEHLNVTHEGHLRIIFTPELKIMSWEFCSRRHEEYLTRRILAPQVNNLLQIAQKYQSTAAESGPTGLSNNDTQTICNMFTTASRQLAKSLELHTLHEHGLSKRYVRCLQISESVNHLKDLMEFTSKNNLGPLEGLNKFCKPSVPKLPVQNMNESKQFAAAAGLPNDQSTTKGAEVKQEMSTHVDGTHGVGATDNNIAQNAAALNNCQNVIRSSSANQGVLQQEASSVFKGTAAMYNGMQLDVARSLRGPNQGQLAQFQHATSFQHPMPHQNSLHGLGVHNNVQGLNASPQYQQHVLQQLLQATNNTNNQASVRQPPPGTPNVSSSLAPGAANSKSDANKQEQHINEGTAKDACTMGTGPSNVINNSTASMVPSRSNSFKSVSSNPAAPPAGGNAAASKANSFHELDGLEGLDNLISNQLAESGLFEGDQGGNGFFWNM